MELLVALGVLALGWCVWSLMDLRRMRKDLERLDRDRERFTEEL